MSGPDLSNRQILSFVLSRRNCPCACSLSEYRVLSNCRIDPHAEEFLSNEQVERQLKVRWNAGLLTCFLPRLTMSKANTNPAYRRGSACPHRNSGRIVEMGFRVLKKILYPVIFSSIILPQKNFRSTISRLTVLICYGSDDPRVYL